MVVHPTADTLPSLVDNFELDNIHSLLDKYQPLLKKAPAGDFLASFSITRQLDTCQRTSLPGPGGPHQATPVTALVTDLRSESRRRPHAVGLARPARIPGALECRGRSSPTVCGVG